MNASEKGTDTGILDTKAIKSPVGTTHRCPYTVTASPYKMKATRIAGFIFLGLLWIWLSQYLLRVGGLNLKNILLVAMTGVIILVPLYRKYIDPANKDNKRK